MKPPVRSNTRCAERSRSGSAATTSGGTSSGSWRGAFVGGELLVRAVTQGTGAERLPGNFPGYTLLPTA
ncbi:hypothetical protein FHR32_005266 [Streptosporangium album]|uniref:Uncharacterized protein n=1 Tax=Streptosporangium album TaxID=47479 RepID=A0A7W7WC52_9ACTN|nr:hypothetical protein [Streptosporangium album]